jgi:iron-sulfur cluster assembly protein
MINVTEKAINEVKRIQSSDPTALGANLRVQVAGGGCSGMSYKLGFDKETPGASDKVFPLKSGEEEIAKLVIDAKSYLYLSGTTLDFSDGLNGTGFVFQNPNAKRTCGCGSSFSV